MGRGRGGTSRGRRHLTRFDEDRAPEPPDREPTPEGGAGSVRADAEMPAPEPSARDPYRRLLEQLPAVLWTVDRDLRFTSSVGGGLRSLGLRPGTVEGLALSEYFGTEDPEFVPLAMHGRAVAGETVRYDFSWQGRTFEVYLEPLKDGAGPPVGAIGLAVDITDRRDVEEALRESEERFRAIFEQSKDAIYITSRDGRVEMMNPAGRELLGYSATDLRQLDVHDLYADGADRRRFQKAIEQDGWVQDFETRLRTSDGSILDALLTATVRRGADGDVVGYQGIIRDITDRKQFEERLRRRALHDPLTELPNRILFDDRIATAVARARREERQMAVLFVDLDRFKVVNDGLGHAAGDQVLLEVGMRFRRVLRAEDTVARFGGDEFTILLEDVEEVVDAVDVVQRLLEVLAVPFVADGREFRLSASVGVALGPIPGEPPGEMIRRADVAMYRAKESGGTAYHIFDPVHDVEETRRFEREGELREAIEAGEVTLFYQPLVDLEAGRLVGVEPLARWIHPGRGLVMPSEFIPLAEETGLIVPLGHRLLERACRDVRSWDAAAGARDPLTLHVNLSAPQLEDPELLEMVDGILSDARVAPERLHFEVTERLAMSRPERIDGLKTLGVRVSVDDFGTGYSSLSYLKRLDVDSLKIDQSFVHGLGRDARDDAIVRTIVTLGRTLGLVVIGEGVEEEVQLRRLRALGCHLAQGYHFARPIPGDELRRLWMSDPRW